MSPYLKTEVVREATISNLADYLSKEKESSVRPQTSIAMFQSGKDIFYFCAIEELIMWSHPTTMGHIGLSDHVPQRHKAGDIGRTALVISTTHLPT